MSHKNFAVLLSGCGYMDGAEVTESVLTLLHIDALGIAYDVFAFDTMQKDVVDHKTKLPIKNATQRNMLSEAARISRVIKDAAHLDPQQYSALIMPGGMGVAKSFSDLATAGAGFEIMAAVEQLVVDFASLKKPIGAICISPAIVAKALKNAGYNPVVTLGDENAILAALEIDQKPCAANEIVVDRLNKIVTTPAYMLDARVSEISKGIEKLISKVQELC